MHEREQRLNDVQSICAGVGTVVMIFTTFLIWTGGTGFGIIIARLGIAIIGLIAYSIKFGAEVSNNEKYGYSMTLLLANIVFIVFAVVTLV